MNSKTKDTAKTKAKAKKRVKLKPTTLAMVRRAKFMRVLYPHGRAFYAGYYREGRRIGRSNMDILDLNQPTPAEVAKRREDEYAALEAATAEQTTKSDLPADPAPHEDSQVLPRQSEVVDEQDSTSPPPPTPRRRRPRAVPQKRQAEFSFGSD